MNATATEQPKAKAKRRNRNEPKSKGLPYMQEIGKKDDSAKRVDGLITKAIKAAGSYRNAAQVALVAIALHAWKHGDWTGIVRLTTELPDGVGKNGIVKWACKFIGLELIDKEEGDAGTGKKFGRFKGAAHIERLFNGDPNGKDKFEKAGAKGTMFWEFAEPNPFAGYDVNDDIRRVRANYDRMVKRFNDPKTTPEERALMKLEANEDAMKLVLQIAKFDVILNGKVVEHVAPAAPEATPAPPVGEQAAPIAVNAH